MIRQIRLLVFFVVGLVLGGGAVSAFAAASSYGRSMNLNYPNGGQARAPGWYSQPRYDFPGAPDGWGHLRDINTLEIGGRRVDLEGVRRFGPRTLARGALGLARSLGPIGIGLTLAELVWDEAQGWLSPSGVDDPVPGVSYWSNGSLMTRCRSASEKCSWNDVVEEFTPKAWGSPSIQNRQYSHVIGTLYGNTVRAMFKGTWNGAPYEAEFWFSYGGEAHGQEQPRSPSSDQELEDAIYTELVARGMGSDLARRLVDAGYTPTPDEVTGTGPASVPGDTITSTTSGPAGQTTTTTQTVHNIAYNTNTTNNTTTVTITNTTTTTTTAPDGSTTTTTETETPSEGETVPPEEPKPFCELYPSASACQELGETPDEELEEESVNVMWDQEGGAAGVCPAPIAVSVLGTQHMIQWTPICQVASGIRPIVIGLAWLSAALWLFVMARARA